MKTSIGQLNQMNSINWSVYFHPENLFHDEKSGRLYYFRKKANIWKSFRWN